MYCTRPGSCIWKASVETGEVTQILDYKEQISESFVNETQSSFSKFNAVSKKIGLDEFKSQSKNKSISHSFSLIHKQQMNSYGGQNLPNILITSNTIGLYLISLDELSVISFIRLDKKVGSILKFILDPHFNDALEKINKQNGKEIESCTRRRSNNGLFMVSTSCIPLSLRDHIF